jgi:hypothetical protein
VAAAQAQVVYHGNDEKSVICCQQRGQDLLASSGLTNFGRERSSWQTPERWRQQLGYSKQNHHKSEAKPRSFYDG